MTTELQPIKAKEILGMKIKIWTDNNANIHSGRAETVDTTELGYTEDEWNGLDEEKQQDAVKEYWLEQGAFEYGWKKS